MKINSSSLSTLDFDYELPEHLIAQYPLPERTDSRLLIIGRDSQTISHHHFFNIIDSIRPQDLVVINDTKVIPARLFGIKQSGGKIECLIERVLSDHEALAHIRASKSPKIGSRIYLESQLEAVISKRDGELFHLRFINKEPLFDLLEQFGHMPLPPYITRTDDVNDHERYQTIFADQRGAVAAPTASLHFDDVLFAKIRQQGTRIAKITLHVGAGTFQPVRVDDLSEHQMHSEWIDVSQHTIDAIKACRARNGRVIAIGTTVMRALETCALSGELTHYQGETDIFIYPGFRFQCVDCLLTNFHLPKSTLLMLVSAFAGIELTRHAYEAAIAAHYRFFSYGDAMFISRGQ